MHFLTDDVSLVDDVYRRINLTQNLYSRDLGKVRIYGKNFPAEAIARDSINTEQW